MCINCLLESLDTTTDDDANEWRIWPEITPLMVAVGDPIRRLYAMDSCSTGGPLHCELEDSNLGDYWFGGDADGAHQRTMPDDVTGGWWAKEFDVAQRAEILNLTQAILWALSAMTEPERHVAVMLAHVMLEPYEGAPRQLVSIAGHPPGVTVTFRAANRAALTRLMEELLTKLPANSPAEGRPVPLRILDWSTPGVDYHERDPDGSGLWQSSSFGSMSWASVQTGDLRVDSLTGADSEVSIDEEGLPTVDG